MSNLNWNELDEFIRVVVQDEQKKIQLIMNVLDLTDEKIVLESPDLIYSMQIFKDDWESGAFKFQRI